MDTEQIEVFCAETLQAFQFLETHYGYQRLEKHIAHPEDPRDTSVGVRYGSGRIGVEVMWSVGNANIVVSFTELFQPMIFPLLREVFPFKDRPTTAKAIRLYDLVDMLGQSDDPDFLLKRVDDYRSHDRRMKVIKARMPEVLASLARATQTYATAILQGDTSIFPQVMKLALAKKKKLFPRMLLPSYIVDDPS